MMKVRVARVGQPDGTTDWAVGIVMTETLGDMTLARSGTVNQAQDGENHFMADDILRVVKSDIMTLIDFDIFPDPDEPGVNRLRDSIGTLEDDPCDDPPDNQSE